MKPILGHFKCVILSPRKLVYDKEIQSLFITGDTGEYEILPYHYPVLGILAVGDIILDWKESIPINFGIVRFFANDCIILIEPEAKKKKIKKKEEEIAYSVDKDD